MAGGLAVGLNSMVAWGKRALIQLELLSGKICWGSPRLSQVKTRPMADLWFLEGTSREAGKAAWQLEQGAVFIRVLGAKHGAWLTNMTESLILQTRAFRERRGSHCHSARLTA